MVDDRDSNGTGHPAALRNLPTATSSKKSKRAFRVAVMGSAYWLKVAAELLGRAGVTCEVVDIQSKRAAVSWMLRCQWRHFDAIHHVYGPNWWWGTSMAILGKPMIGCRYDSYPAGIRETLRWPVLTLPRPFRLGF